MKLSYVIVSHNRRDSLLKTLGQLETNTPLPRSAWEAWVVDNASADGSVDAVRATFPNTRIIQRDRNEGVGARSHAFGPARGQYLILLDDDSYPIGSAVTDSIDYLEAHPSCAAVVGRVILADGSLEACAFPAVMLSGAVCVRKSVVDQVGGFRPEFFRKAGEYDFSFRIWKAGFSVERFEDVVYRHDKVMTGRSPGFAHRMDLRNNLILVERFLPAEYRRIYRQDFVQRYSALARHAGHMPAVRRALIEAVAWRVREWSQGRNVLDRTVLETVFGWRGQQQRVEAWAREHQIRRVAIADFSKNLYATHRACETSGLSVEAIVDDHPAFSGLDYRSVRVGPFASLERSRIDGVVVSNVNPAQLDRIAAKASEAYGRPVLTLWQPRFLRSRESERRAA